MRIGFDAKWYFTGPASGRIVVRRQLEALAKMAGVHSIVAILDRRWEGHALEGAAAGLEREWMWARNNLLANAFGLNGVARRQRLDVILCQNFVPISPWCPTVAFIHDILFREFPQFYTMTERAYFAPMGVLVRSATRVCTVSHTERARIVGAKLAELADTDVAYHGVDSEFRIREQFDRAALAAVASRFNLPDRFVLFVGRLNVRKNVDNLLRAMALITDHSIPLVIVGDPDWRTSDARALATELGILNRVRFTGSIDHDVLPLVYALAEVFVFPSLAESFGLPPLEAMASGIPCVVSDATSLPEICDGAALLVKAESPQMIGQAIDRVLADSSLRADLRRRGLDRAATLTWDNSAAAVVASCERAVAVAGGR